MKLSPLLSEFLTTNKQLGLAGIGKFTLDDAGSVNFEQDTSIREDANLVNYIAEKSGKMKSLVASDLDSHLELARQFLNIGKPYLFEGIGTLSKNKFGQFDFAKVSTLTERKETGSEGRDMTQTTENSFTDYQEMFSPKKAKTPAARRIAGWLIVLAGLSLAVFGGYLVYNKTKNKTPESISKTAEPVIVPQQQVPVTANPDSLQTARKDSVGNNKSLAASSNSYRFVIEKASKARAIYRYNYLKNNFINVQMDTKDSILFKLYFTLPSSPADTIKKRDSLQRLYGTRGRVTVELN